jgi:hypothetical protein
VDKDITYCVYLDIELELSRYRSTNIYSYRVWIPHQGKVISTRDVIFDEEPFFEKKDLPSDKELIAFMDKLVARVSLKPAAYSG